MKKITLDGINLIASFDRDLASYAQRNSESRGRVYTEPLDPNRLPYQRDRDRVLHSTSFRRLIGKMQVVSPRYGDHFRNRLTHSLEVSQMARDMARQLGLNEDLAEAIALAHDLGHPPFGHAGERALDVKMKEQGQRFDHNKQSLRIVTAFEQRYPEFPGLNLSQEVLEGVQKHERKFERADGTSFYFPHLESQLVDICDEIAYLSADLEDGIRGGFIQIEDLKKATITKEVIEEVGTAHRSTVIRRTIRNLLAQLVEDTEAKIADLNIESVEDVQQSKVFIVGFNREYYGLFRELKQFMFDHYYLNPEVKEMSDRGVEMIYKVFDFLREHPDKIPDNFLPNEDLDRRVCDYIAGMTDHFLQNFYNDIR